MMKDAVARCALGAALLFGAGAPQAVQQQAFSAAITELLVNGGADTSNPGTSCIKIAAPVSARCDQGYIAIPNNNGRLLAMALAAKASAAPVWVYYEDASPALQHCPGLVFTPCAVISIGTR